jgi:superfamily II DNA or RNA helicase
LFPIEYGQVIVDECHHVSAFTFERELRKVKARYVVGLTATPVRKDGHHPIILMQCGPIRFNVGSKKHAATSGFQHEVIPRLTEFAVPAEWSGIGIQDIYAALVNDEQRTDLIVADIVRAIEDGRVPLVLTERTEHLQAFVEKLSRRVPNVFEMRGGMGKKQRDALAFEIKAVPENQQRVIIATGRYIGEGFDDARLDTLFLAIPISWRGTLQQYVGRLHRLHENKHVVRVYDYVDARVPVLNRMYEKRLKAYKTVGYTMARPKGAEDAQADLRFAEIEHIAVQAAIDFEEARGCSVESVENETRGFDLISRRFLSVEPYISRRVSEGKLCSICSAVAPSLNSCTLLMLHLLLFDENFNHRILHGLELRVPNLDYVVAQEIELKGAKDPDLLAWAAEQNRIVVTHDLETMLKYAYDRVAAGKECPE